MGKNFSKCENRSDDHIPGQSLWNNNFICAKSKSLYVESPSKKRITKICDLFNRDGVFKNWDSVSQEFNLRPTHLLEWYGVLNSIPNKWKRRIKNVTVEQTTLAKTSVGIETDKKLVSLELVTTKIIYKLFISGKFEPSTSKKLFSNQYNIYDEGTWRIIYSLPARVTTDIKIRLFRYKVLNNILFLNQRLYYMKKIDSPLCSLCKREVETVPHLFLKCGQSENFW